MSYALGIKLIRRMCVEQHPLSWQRAKLSAKLFKAMEAPIFEWVETHLKTHHVLPHPDTLETQFPDVAAIATPEPASYYLLHVENRFAYDRINRANLEAQAVLTADQDANDAALTILRDCTNEILMQRQRTKIVDVKAEAADLVLHAYHQAAADAMAIFGWPYMDQQTGGLRAADVVSFVGRPATGKTWKMMWSAKMNWMVKKVNTLVCSMEMAPLPLAQRLTSMYAHQPFNQLITSGFSTPTLKKFYTSLKAIKHEDAEFYIIDGNLATSVEEIFAIAEMLKCKLVFIDGAYLLRHQNAKLDRFTRAAENVELIKRYCGELGAVSFCSWQFNREATKKQKKSKGQDHGDLEDIGYSDAISQISSVVLALFQEDGIETMKERKIKVLKGRNGEVGQFSIGWDFNSMDFSQRSPSTTTALPEQENQELQWV